MFFFFTLVLQRHQKQNIQHEQEKEDRGRGKIGGKQKDERRKEERYHGLASDAKCPLQSRHPRSHLVLFVSSSKQQEN